MEWKLCECVNTLETWYGRCEQLFERMNGILVKKKKMMNGILVVVCVKSRRCDVRAVWCRCDGDGRVLE